MNGGAADTVTLPLDTLLTALPGVGPRHKPRLEKLGLVTVADLLNYLPRRYEDTRVLVPLRALVPGEVQTTRARLVSASMRRSPKRRMILVEAVLEDDGARVEAVWFNQAFLMKQLTTGMEMILSGPVTVTRTGLQLRNPKFERHGADQHHVGTLAAIYPETEGLTSKFLRELVERVLPSIADVPDVLPESVRRDEGLMPIAEALHAAHAPSTPDEAERARERVAFEELFLLQLAAQRARRRRLAESGVVVEYDVSVAKRFAESLPFTLTDGQRVAGHQILTDMAAPGVMNRLLQGDVGSGKTAVAALAALMTHHAGKQIAIMAPTEILARQHHATLDKLLSPLDLPSRLLVGSTPVRARREILDGLAAGHDPMVVGTHALLEDDVKFADLGLVVVDEQHRFGVVQRQRLRLKSTMQPNFLAMTATPIPRSLTLTVWGDVDVSELRDMPPGRMPVTTRVVAPHDREAAYGFVRAQVAEGRQVFVICPLVEESDKLGVKSVTAEYERLRTSVFPELRVQLLHGRMPAREKEERMRGFAEGESDILVATSVVEVGVDVPNASVMIIEAAERFGLAQLHQFRGRVGRGGHASHCLLFDSGADEEATGRLDQVAATQSGFDIAELDLRTRGPGDVVGLRQHGLPEMRAADLLDMVMAARARDAATAWLDADPELSAYQPLHAAMHGYTAVFDLD